jgi:hypothetical protein
MFEGRLAKSGERVCETVLNIGLRIEAALVCRGIAAPGRKEVRLFNSFRVKASILRAPNGFCGASAVLTPFVMIYVLEEKGSRHLGGSIHVSEEKGRTLSATATVF